MSDIAANARSLARAHARLLMEEMPDTGRASTYAGVCAHCGGSGTQMVPPDLSQIMRGASPTDRIEVECWDCWGTGR